MSRVRRAGIQCIDLCVGDVGFVAHDLARGVAGKQIGRLDLLTQKAMDCTTPVGPWIVTPDALRITGQPALDMRLSVNDELRQQDNTRQMIFPLDELLNYLDARISLRPGDLVFTGSSHGVGLESGRFLQAGDQVEAQIQGIGRLRNTIAGPRPLSPSRAIGRLGQQQRALELAGQRAVIGMGQGKEGFGTGVVGGGIGKKDRKSVV